MKCERSAGHSNGDVTWAVGCINLESKTGVWAGDIKFEIFTVYVGLSHGIEENIE